jgi:hypothetical protein
MAAAPRVHVFKSRFLKDVPDAQQAGVSNASVAIARLCNYVFERLFRYDSRRISI